MIYKTKIFVIEAKEGCKWYPCFCAGNDCWDFLAPTAGISDALVLWNEGELTNDTKEAEQFRQEAEEALGLPCRVAAYKIKRAK